MTQKQDDRKQTGAIGERIAEQFLREQGYLITELNWRCRTGEIDIIAESERTIVFIEVRTRKRAGSFGTAKESVNARKQRQVRETAQVYLHRFRKYEQSIRFDVITIEWLNDEDKPYLEHLIGAF